MRTFDQTLSLQNNNGDKASHLKQQGKVFECVTVLEVSGDTIPIYCNWQIIYYISGS